MDRWGPKHVELTYVMNKLDVSCWTAYILQDDTRFLQYQVRRIHIVFFLCCTSLGSTEVTVFTLKHAPLCWTYFNDLGKFLLTLMFMVWTVMEPDIKFLIFVFVKNRMSIDFEENRCEWRWSESGKSWIIDTGVGVLMKISGMNSCYHTIPCTRWF